MVLLPNHDGDYNERRRNHEHRAFDDPDIDAEAAENHRNRIHDQVQQNREREEPEPLVVLGREPNEHGKRNMDRYRTQPLHRANERHPGGHGN